MGCWASTPGFVGRVAGNSSQHRIAASIKGKQLFRAAAPTRSALTPSTLQAACPSRPSLKNRLLNIGREQRQLQKSGDVAARDVLCLGDLARRPIPPLVQQPLPPMRPCQRANQCLVRPRVRRRPGQASLPGAEWETAHLIPSFFLVSHLRPSKRLVTSFGQGDYHCGIA
jgi:hypothetical protein